MASMSYLQVRSGRTCNTLKRIEYNEIELINIKGNMKRGSIVNTASPYCKLNDIIMGIRSDRPTTTDVPISQEAHSNPL